MGSRTAPKYRRSRRTMPRDRQRRRWREGNWPRGTRPSVTRSGLRAGKARSAHSSGYVKQQLRIRNSGSPQEMDRFTMRESGECYVFDDDRIWHILTPVAVMEGNQYAYRDTLAFDMLPEGWEPVK